MSDNADNVLKLSTSNWISVVGMIAAASVANIAGIHTMTNATREELRSNMVELDEKWQTRTERLALDIKGDIADVKRGIPPDWFRAMVEKHSEEIEEIERRLDVVEKKP